MGKQEEEERLEMSNGNGHEGGRRGAPVAASDRPELVGKGKGRDIFRVIVI